MNSSTESEFEASVGLSRKWDAREAGREVARTAIKDLSRPPSFVLLFSTIHYEKHGGFEEFLAGVWDVLPKETPLVGGTVAGFMNNFGCYTRGCSALAVSSLEINVKVGMGTNTKKNPKKAVESAFNDIYSEDRHKYNAIVELLPTAVIPKIPGMGQKNVILSKKMGDGFLKLFPAMKKLNYGYDRADEIIELVAEKNKDSIIIGGCTMDDNNFLRNYLFHGSEIEKNALLTLSISSSKEINSKTIVGYKVQDIKFNIDEISDDGHIIKKFNGKGARSALFEKLNLKIEEKEAVYHLYKNIYYYPLGFEKNGLWHACMIGLIYGENLIFGNIINDKELTLLTLSVRNTMKELDESVDYFYQKGSSFVFGFACETVLETLGKSIFEVQNSFKRIGVPFVVPFVAGESIYTPKIGAHHLYESINLISI